MLLSWLYAHGSSCEEINPCCESCSKFQSGTLNHTDMAWWRYIHINEYFEEVFVMGSDLFDWYVTDRMLDYFYEDTDVYLWFAGTYKGPQGIFEYFSLHNRYVTDYRHFTGPDVAHRAFNSLSYNETYVSFNITSTFAYRPQLSNGSFEQKLYKSPFVSTFYFNSAFEHKPYHGTVHFPKGDLEEMISAFRNNVELCETIQTHCVGKHQQYESVATCVAYMDSLPETKQGCPPYAGPTTACKNVHVYLTRKDFRPETHCYHCGPVGTKDPFGRLKCSPNDCAPQINQINPSIAMTGFAAFVAMYFMFYMH